MPKSQVKVKRISGATNDKIRALADGVLKLPQIPMRTVHRFSDGVYLRELVIPAGTFIIGREHRTAHWNIMLSGKMRLLMDGVSTDIEAPYVVKSDAGTMKVAVALEETRWLTIHANPTNEKKMERLENMLAVPHPAKKEVR